MPPSPGKIHSLPIKVLYSIDTSPQTYLAILNDRQDVYIHPGTLAYGLEDNQGLLGSCSLKSVARGICYSSPECVPDGNLDFSIYNLDPSIRNRIARAFTSSTTPSTDSEASWAGKGFLSWILDEPSSGSTLIKGRVVREYEFAPANFIGQGGLEGLMAAASASSSASRIGSNREDADGKGWGLEVGITLRQLKPDGKAEFAGREAFREMLARGRNGSTIPATTTTAISTSHPPPRVSVSSTSTTATPATNRTPTNQPSSYTAPVQSTSSAPSRQTPTSNQSTLLSRPPLPSIKSVHSSSTPMASSSSATDNNTKRAPERKNIATTAKPDPTTRRTPPPPQHHTGKTPPPPSPSHLALSALLRQEGKFSPEACRQLASNPTLLRLIKSVPQSAAALSALRNGVNLSTNTGGIVEPSTMNTLSSVSNTNEMAKHSPVVDTPTPSNTTPVKSGSATDSSANLCYNCGATESDIWRTKRLKDGTQGKVCNACGLYFNKHKKMRPKELWNPNSSGDVKAKSDPTPPATIPQSQTLNPPLGIRSSPRRARNPPSDTQRQLTDSPRKRQKTSGKTNQPQPSPRMATRASAAKPDPSDVDGHTLNGHSLPNLTDSINGHWEAKTNDQGQDLFGFSISPTPMSIAPPTLLSGGNDGKSTKSFGPDEHHQSIGAVDSSRPEGHYNTNGLDFEALLAHFPPSAAAIGGVAGIDSGPGASLGSGSEVMINCQEFNLDAFLAGMSSVGVGGGESEQGGGVGMGTAVELDGHGNVSVRSEGGGGVMDPQELMDFLAGLEGFDMTQIGELGGSLQVVTEHGPGSGEGGVENGGSVTMTTDDEVKKDRFD